MSALKGAFHLERFDGRFWQGRYPHALMTMVAYAFMLHRRLTQMCRGKKNRRNAASAEPAHVELHD
ncbi:MAG: hypothetical protein BGP06_09270 [Rhizobiales bacterium 65-9]|nr:MAG: hypothetical protein BGP06_09270 [Rhizobiales bacterium 65-9]